ncbi:MAG: HupE/UreJ family protein [Cytophagales bacterium]|nr:MAG: HupE/UreJ family protein [Cytophagales bacterium]
MYLTPTQFGEIEQAIMAAVSKSFPKVANLHQVCYLLFFTLFFGEIAYAHPMPNTVIELTIQHKSIQMDILMPLSEFELAFGQKIGSNINENEQFRRYFQEHIRLQGKDKQTWEVKFISATIQETNSEIVGKYSELAVRIQIFPKTDSDIRYFLLFYDVIIHQVITHEALLNVVQDWESGQHENLLPIGVVKLDIPTGKIFPLEINLGEGSLWKGFKTMLVLGANHIAEGTDHLLFLLILLVPAPLLVKNKKWSSFGGLRYTVRKLVSIITAFTAGHSVTLLLGTLAWIPFSSQLIEVMIGFSILISAFHAYRPLFFGKEIYIAAGFGLIHGLAFSDTLSKLHLDALQMGLSIFGFNVGIELMQICIMLLVLPPLMLLSKRPIYANFRILMSCLAAFAALFWIVERIAGG